MHRVVITLGKEKRNAEKELKRQRCDGVRQNKIRAKEERDQTDEAD